MTQLPRGCLSEGRTLDDVVAVAANAFGVTPEDLVGDSRARQLTRYRHMAMAAARVLGHSFPTIGSAFSRDHSTVVNAVMRAKRDDEMTRKAEIIAEAVRNSTGRLL